MQKLDEILSLVQNKHRSDLDAHLAEIDMDTTPAPASLSLPPPAKPLSGSSDLSVLARVPSIEQGKGGSIDDSMVVPKVLQS